MRSTLEVIEGASAGTALGALLIGVLASDAHDWWSVGLCATIGVAACAAGWFCDRLLAEMDFTPYVEGYDPAAVTQSAPAGTPRAVYHVRARTRPLPQAEPIEHR